MNKVYRHALMLCILPAFILALATDACCDQVIIDNGDTLSGTIEKTVGGKLTLKTEYAGAVVIDTARIKKISTEAPVEVHLQSGEVLKGQINTTEDGRFIIEKSEGREETAFDWNKVASINPPPVKWTGSITVGANDQTGNTHRYGAAVAFDAARRTETDRFTLGYHFNYAHENQEITARNHYGYMKYDYFFTKKFYGYISTELLSDTFRDLTLRVAVGPGAGYQFWDDETKFLNAEAGLSYVHESRKIGQENDFTTIRLGSNLRYNIFSFLIFTDKLIIYPRLDHFGRYILRNEAGLGAPVSPAWALNLANIIDRDSNPAPGRGKNDIQWILGLKYSF